MGGKVSSTSTCGLGGALRWVSGGLGTPRCRAGPWLGVPGAGGQKTWRVPKAYNEMQNWCRATVFSRSKGLCAA